MSLQWTKNTCYDFMPVCHCLFFCVRVVYSGTNNTFSMPVMLSFWGREENKSAVLEMLARHGFTLTQMGQKGLTVVLTVEKVIYLWYSVMQHGHLCIIILKEHFSFDLFSCCINVETRCYEINQPCLFMVDHVIIVIQKCSDIFIF